MPSHDQFQPQDPFLYRVGPGDDFLQSRRIALMVDARIESLHFGDECGVPFLMAPGLDPPLLLCDVAHALELYTGRRSNGCDEIPTGDAQSHAAGALLTRRRARHPDPRKDP